MAEQNKFHECEMLEKQNNISVQKINGSWFWVFWSEKERNQAHGIICCPYCGKRLDEPASGKEAISRLFR